MSVNPSEFEAVHYPDMTHENLRGVERVKKNIDIYCDDIVEFVYRGVAKHLDSDRRMREGRYEGRFAPGQVVRQFVKQDSSMTAPMEGGKPVRTFFTMVKPKADAILDEQLMDQAHLTQPPYMKLCVPVGDLDINRYLMPPKAEVDKAYVHVNDGDQKHWYMVARDGGLFEYVPAVRNDGEDAWLLPDLGSWTDIGDPEIPETFRTVNELYERVVNWRIVPQILHTIE